MLCVCNVLDALMVSSVYVPPCGSVCKCVSVCVCWVCIFAVCEGSKRRARWLELGRVKVRVGEG